ncbi:MAG: phage major capsid protein [Ruminococcus sp.]|nr:phage major capsid protein [Ruminococcus sp.]
MDIKEMTVEQLEERKAAIAAEIDNEDADLDALEAEARAIKEEIENRKAQEAKKVEIRAAVASGEGETTKTFKTEEKKEMTIDEVRSSKEYINAYANYIKTGKDDECRALLTTLATGGQVPVPTVIEGRIRQAWQRNGLMELVRKTYVPGILKVGFELSADPAYIHSEGSTANTEEALTFGVVTMTPESIKKWITISDEALDLGGEEFLDYIYDELTYQIAKKAQSELISKITALTASATTEAVGVGVVAGTPSLGVVAAALGQLSDQATNPVIVMNKGTWAQFKAAQYAGPFNIDPFEGRDVYFDSSLPAYTAGGTTGSTWMVVGDFGVGAHANFPNGDEIGIKYDPLSLAERDLVKLVGREYVGLGIVADHAFCKITF